MADPKYVRLADHLSDSVQADVSGGSGWSISGRDVKPFPEGDQAARFVRSRLVMGLLEPAGKAEYDEVVGSNKAVAQAAEGDHQEAAIQEAAQAAADKLTASRASAGGDDDDDEDDEPDIDAMTSDELNTALEAAGLTKTGNMEARRARLREAQS